MYDKEFIFGECGFEWVPEYIDRDLLFNVSYEVATGEIKLYVLNDDRTVLYKVSRSGITEQVAALESGADAEPLAEFLGVELDYEDVLLDTVEGQVYYVYVEESSYNQCAKLLAAVCVKYGLPEQQLVAVVNRINERSVQNIRECATRRAVSLVKVPLLTRGCKVYSRPFKTGNSYQLDERTVEFLARLHGCDRSALPRHLTYLWVSAELFSDRVVVTTQAHHLVHAP